MKLYRRSPASDKFSFPQMLDIYFEIEINQNREDHTKE
jgi:hypothetical protein